MGNKGYRNFKASPHRSVKKKKINVRSLVNKIDQFRLHFENSGIDIITLSETWLHRDICSNILQLDGYQLFRWDRTVLNVGQDTAKRGGVV